MFTFRSSYVGCFIALIAQNYVEFYNLTVADRTNCFLWIVLNNGSLMNEYILFRVIAIDETIAALYIEPFYGSGYFFGCDKKERKKKKKNNNRKKKEFQNLIKFVYYELRTAKL